MKGLFAILFVLLSLTFAYGQNEQAPILEKDINYKNWTLKSIRTGEDVTLRDLTVGKKLVIVVYYAPWCPNWRYDAPFLQRYYDKYKANGLEIVAVGAYDPLASMKNNLESLKITFPAVYESELRTDKQKTKHYEYRRSVGDTRNWGSPWYILLEPSAFEKTGDTLVKRSNIVNGEMIEVEGEKFIRQKLGLPPVETKGSIAVNDTVEVCDPDKKSATLIKP